LSEWFRDFSDLRLRVQRNIACDFAKRADAQSERSRDQAVAMTVPRHLWQFESQLFGQILSDLGAALAKSSARSDGATKLEHQRSALRFLQSLAMAATASNQPATFAPKLVGKACCIHVRPTTIVERCLVANFAKLVAKRSRSLAISFSPSRNCNTMPVSMASRLVAPQCT
jgi:hypothetical protein